MIPIISRLFRHGPVVLTVLFLLFTLDFSAAQRLPSQPPPFSDPLPQPKFNPSLALLMLIIVGAFFCLGFFSIYIRRCTERRYGGHGLNAAVLGGVGRFSRRRQPGLDAAVIGTFPTFLYSAVKGHKLGKESLECAVCLNEFEDDETLRLLPKCSHVFHPDCIDAWLASHTTCPVCRADLVPKPGDIAFNSDTLFQPDNIGGNDAQSEIHIRVSDATDQNRTSEPAQSPIRPPRSWSTGWRLGSLFPKSRSTGHLLVQPGDNIERFTLRLPEEIRNQLLNTDLNRAKSAVAFPRAASTKRGYRSRSGGSWRGKNYYYFDRFDPEAPPADGIGIPVKSGSVRSSNGEKSNNVNPLKNSNLLRSIKSTFEFRIYGVDKSSSSSSKKDAGEASFDRLTPAGRESGRDNEIV